MEVCMCANASVCVWVSTYMCEFTLFNLELSFMKLVACHTPRHWANFPHYEPWWVYQV